MAASRTEGAQIRPRARRRRRRASFASCSAEPGLVAQQQGGDLLRRQGPAEVEALREGATLVEEELALILGLDSLRDHLAAQALRELDDRSDDCGRLLVLGHVAHEGA